ncbi:protein-L-isoaspartate(D-aspartate) O-methyltransferase [Oceanicella actignis]|uniref:protein-L-isoaspartate(D-aspartate) O-methyltransferase n=1 Tax=Oceanicella actignis TaxID=1189325 RepID=UPI0011E62FDC|nr:protein-L-isoaspartate(D-aspartate) O-methyltransferase [Oceanicella actignis]TYO89951.1 protein-L-isoaspartate(D-aspartate) O-methyltransferase [Oceanicella actignis]
MSAAPEHDDAPDALREGRMKLVFALRSRGVTDARVLDAIERTPRELFLDRAFRDRALEDVALPIACGQTISQPSIVGLMTQALEVTPRCKVLEVGCGSGYQAAVLARLARRVYTIERHRPLARRARALLERELDLHNVTVIAGDGASGLPEQAPFDRIILTCAAEDTPSELLAQLRVGGVMVLPVGQSDEIQQLIRIRRTPEGLDYQDLAPVRFVPLLEGMAEDPDEG